MTEEPTLLGGRYELGSVLGRGGMAEVRRARDHRLGREVAVKQLRVDLATDPTFQVRFRREAQAAAGLNHPNIVAVYDTGEQADVRTGVQVPYIVMELVEGHTLRELLRTGRQIQPAKALEFSQGVLSALSYSHKAGIVHRDIKPANVMLTTDGTVKVMDFGIARAVADTSATMTQTAAVIGTAQYLSPEQARGETVDSRSDIYSAGCLLYELLVGRPPFQGDSPVSVAYQHVREQPVPPSHLDPMVTPAMDTVVLKALAKDPADRYQTAAAMRVDLGRILAGQEVTTRVPATALEPAALQPTMVVPLPETAAETTSQTGAMRAIEPEKKRRTGLWVGILTVVAILAGIGLFLVLNPQNQVQMVEVPAVSEFRQNVAEQTLRDAGLIPEIADVVGPDGDTVGRVVGQSIPPGTQVEKGTRVVISVNVGPTKQVIPAGLIGERVSDAEKTLRDLGFTRVTTQVDPDESVSAKANEVTRVNPAEGANVALDQEVIIYFASGESAVPNLRGLTRSQAEAAAKDAGFTKVRFQDVVSTQEVGTVVGQSPEVGSVVKRSTTIVLDLAKAAPPPSTPPATPSTTPTETPTDPEGEEGG